MKTLKVGVVGAQGRMGQQVAGCVVEAPDCSLAALVVEPGDPAVGSASPYPDGPDFTDDLEGAVPGLGVIIDFSLPEAFPLVLEAAFRHRVPLVSGTTGLNSDDVSRLDELGTVVPCFYSPNMSVGIQVMLELITQAVTAFGSDYDLAVVESHHRHKRDAPSGTAKRILATLASSRTPRIEPGAIDVHAIRGGDVVGDHTVHFLGPGDRLEITHRATSRRTFAMGALRAARWLVRQPPGRYGMADLLRDAGNERTDSEV